jgi:hypothetical protein
VNISDRRLALSLPHLLIVIVVLIPTLLAMSSATAAQDSSLGASHDTAMVPAIRMAPPPPPPIGTTPIYRNYPAVAVDDFFIVHTTWYNELPIFSNDFDREGDFFIPCHLYGFGDALDEPLAYYSYPTDPVTHEVIGGAEYIVLLLPEGFVGTFTFQYDLCGPPWWDMRPSNVATVTVLLPPA